VIVGSLVLILGAVAFLALGLMRGSNAYLVVSIVASLLAAIALVVGSRQPGAAKDRAAKDRAAKDRAAKDLAATPGRGRAAKRADEEVREPAGRGHTRRDRITEVIPAVRTDGPDQAAEEAPARQGAVAVQETATIPAEGGPPDQDRGPTGQITVDESDDEDSDLEDRDPPDEPVAQQVSESDAARVAQMTNEVRVIDGRPRYHLPSCAHLRGRDSEPLPVHEAVELGFTPCGLCEPDSSLLAEARQV
jgi:hypothetical protein